CVASSSVGTAAIRGSISCGIVRPGNGYTAHTAMFHSRARRATMSSYSGRSDQMSGAITRPIVGDGTVVSISAGVPDGSTMRTLQVLPTKGRADDDGVVTVTAR
ncbi:MAG: hypothetical protein ACKOE7_16380, partial [Actinomycetota bacterium]